MTVNTAISIEIPKNVYVELQSLAKQLDLVDMLAQWAKSARQRRTWQQDLQALRDLIKKKAASA